MAVSENGWIFGQNRSLMGQEFELRHFEKINYLYLLFILEENASACQRDDIAGYDMNYAWGRPF
jgi:hypothetical protein